MKVKERLITGMKSELMSGEISKPEALSLFAHVTGMLIAMQDQRTMSPDEAMNIVAKNIEQGNASAIEQIFEGPGGNA
ncbi:hypothetical protein [Phaeobacter inhibens]|uniref:hypothetical protein n=1 Tax=Phaeobacter inhibens TaxID=221822 RepID=UPI00295E4821|nr:hypothetical protein [Phaeobacter inhibens]